MRIKKFLLLSFLIFIFIFPSFGEKKQKPLTLAELQNPKGRFYVPIPYPQNRKEIIIDLIYAIEDLYHQKKEDRYYGVQRSESEILPLLLGAKPLLYVGKIITAANRTFLRSERNFVMDIHDASGVVVARVALEDSGLFAGARFAGGGHVIRPFMSLSDARDFFANSRVAKLAAAQVESIEYENFDGTSFSNPYLKIKTKTGIFYMDMRDRIFEFQEKKQFSSEKEILKFKVELFKKYDDHNLKRPFDRGLLNSNTLEAFFLKIVE